MSASEAGRPETTAEVFWRMVGEGVSSFDIGHHPDYQAALQRERETHAGGCGFRDGTSFVCSCPSDAASSPSSDRGSALVPLLLFACLLFGLAGLALSP